MNKKEEIIEIAQEVIQTEGISSLNFRSLAKETQIKSSSVHYYFPKKEDLIFEVSQKYKNDFQKIYQSISQVKSTAKERLDMLIEIFFSSREQGKMCLGGVLALSNEQLDSKSRKTISLFFNELSEWVEHLIEEAKQSKEIETKVSSDELAKIIVASLEGALLIDKMKGTDRYINAAKTMVHTLIK